MRRTRNAGHPLGDDEAVSQVLAFLVAAVVFLVAIGAILITAIDNGDGDQDASDNARQSLEAASLADLVLGSPGLGWEGGADGLQRLGLQNANGSGIDLDAVATLRGALYDADPSNGKVDYEEARASLGMPDGTQFHLRMYPVGLDTVYEKVLTGTRVGYIGDWLSLPPIVVAAGTPEGMVVEANAMLNLTIGPNTAAERQAVVDLGVDFTNHVHVTATRPTVLMDGLLVDPTLYSVVGALPLQGDVYPDIKSYLDNVLAARIDEYDVLVVGSGVDHASLTADATKSAIKDFVLEGGTLMVMGSSAQSTQWLQPLFSVGIKTVNGGPFTPDVSHPLLHEPHTLDWDSYDHHGLGWDIKSTGSGAHYDDFTHVIVADGKDILAVSNDGAFGEGRIFLTEYRPREIADDLGALEAENFLGNMFLYAERDHLYLEYGPVVADGAAVSAAIRQSHAWESELGLVPVRFELHLWHTA